MEELDRVRAICVALPEVEERLSHGEASWFTRGRQFAMFADRHHDDRIAFWCAAPEAAQEALVAAAPQRFFRPPYVGARGWLGVYLDVPVDWAEIVAIVAEAHAVVQSAAGRRRSPDRG